MTGGKTRQKRNGPGGSGCFHAFCYFLAWPAQGFARRRPAGADLVHDSTQKPVPPFPLHQVREPFRRPAGADLVHDSTQNPVPPFPLHQVRETFRRPAGADLVHDSSQNPVLSFPLHQVREPFRRPAGADLVHDSPQNLALSSTGTTSLGLKAPPASRTWCFTPRKTLLFRQRAPRLWDQRRRWRAGRGASLPANPCSFVDGHHVFGTKGAAGEPDVVLHPPQTLALSSTGTTSLGSKAPPANRTWCFTPRKTLLFRQRAPCLWDQRRSAGADLVHDSSQNPVLSSTGTTSLGPKAPPASDPIIISPRGKELTTGPRGRAFRRQFLPISTGIAGIRDSQESCCSPGRFHPIKTPSRKRRVLIFSCYSLPRPLPRPATRRSTSVSFISSDTIMPSISSSFSTSSSGKRFRIRWQTMLM